MGVSVVASSFLNLFVPSAAASSLGTALFLQALIGLIQAAAFPSCYYLYPRWMPVSERTIMVAFVVSGVFLV